MWCVAELNADYIQRMEDVLAVYEKPYNPAEPVVCLDEKPVSLHADVRAPIPAKPGKVAKRDNEYKRCGTANVFGVVEPKAGRHFTIATPNRSAFQFAQVVYRLALQYPEAKRVHLVMDNLNTHKMASLYEAFAPDEARRVIARLEVHYTPKHGSWLNMAETELSVMTKQCLRRRIPDKPKLVREVSAWESSRNTAHCRIDWRFTTADARIKLKRLYPSIEVG